jgi:hypothetical protein
MKRILILDSNDLAHPYDKTQLKPDDFVDGVQDKIRKAHIVVFTHGGDILQTVKNTVGIRGHLCWIL